jgi:hypothetical protein
MDLEYFGVLSFSALPPSRRQATILFLIIRPDRAMSHDQNFKNLVLDYPRHALAFFAGVEATGINEYARIVPIRRSGCRSARVRADRPHHHRYGVGEHSWTGQYRCTVFRLR